MSRVALAQKKSPGYDGTLIAAWAGRAAVFNITMRLDTYYPNWHYVRKEVMTIYYRPPTNPDGSKMTCAQRRAERRAANAERRAQQKQEPIGHDPIFDLPCDERRRLRRTEQQGRQEGEQRAAIEAKEQCRAEIAATPEHLRRPENVFSRLLSEWESKSYRPEIARKIRHYKKLEARKGNRRRNVSETSAIRSRKQPGD